MDSKCQCAREGFREIEMKISAIHGNMDEDLHYIFVILPIELKVVM